MLAVQAFGDHGDETYGRNDRQRSELEDVFHGGL